MIELHDIHKQFQRTEVLCGITLQVQAGEVAVLIGPSGGGKSTLLRTINGLESFDRGSVRVGDLLLSPGKVNEIVAGKIRQQVGMVFQQFNLFPHLSVLQNVAMAPQAVLRVPRDQAELRGIELLRRVGLAEKIGARPATLSGGQQQRVAIARALAMNPKAILFDEPTSALDPRMTAEVVAVIADLAAAGQTMVIVTHGLQFARSVAHTVHVMHAGRIAESGTPDQIFDAPTQPVTREFLADINSTG